jgi:hypothetical protein
MWRNQLAPFSEYKIEEGLACSLESVITVYQLQTVTFQNAVILTSRTPKIFLIPICANTKDGSVLFPRLSEY